MATELTLSEAADLSGYTRQHIHEEIRAGRIAARLVETPGQPQGMWLINKRSFIAWMKKRARALGA